MATKTNKLEHTLENQTRKTKHENNVNADRHNRLPIHGRRSWLALQPVMAVPPVCFFVIFGGWCTLCLHALPALRVFSQQRGFWSQNSQKRDRENSCACECVTFSHLCFFLFRLVPCASDDLAITYNDQSVLENFHACLLFRALKEPHLNIFART